MFLVKIGMLKISLLPYNSCDPEYDFDDSIINFRHTFVNLFLIRPTGGGRVSVNNAENASTSLSTNVDVHRPSADDAIDNINLTTVNNELYNQDTYLTPTSPVSSEPDNKTVPLLGQQNSSPRKEQTDSPSIDKKDTKNENDTPLFIKKLLENKSPINSKGNSCKNKNVIYPCEKLSLLMGNGSARFSTSITELSEEPDETLRIEI